VPASINILNATPLSLRELEHIVKSVQSIFELPVFARNERLDLEQAYDPTRRQFNSTVLLAQTLLKPNPNKNKLIPIVNVDLYVPILTYVFGEAQLNGTAAIVSMHRLSNVYYGIPNDHKLMLTRLEKEIVHELGHTFGLIHCHQSTAKLTITGTKRRFWDVNISKLQKEILSISKLIKISPFSHISHIVGVQRVE
jgi:archaemetzincin